jgi:hypothetical protein
MKNYSLHHPYKLKQMNDHIGVKVLICMGSAENVKVPQPHLKTGNTKRIKARPKPCSLSPIFVASPPPPPTKKETKHYSSV